MPKKKKNNTWDEERLELRQHLRLVPRLDKRLGNWKKRKRNMRKMKWFGKLGILRKWKVLISVSFKNVCLEGAITARSKFKCLPQRVPHRMYLNQCDHLSEYMPTSQESEKYFYQPPIIRVEQLDWSMKFIKFLVLIRFTLSTRNWRTGIWLIKRQLLNIHSSIMCSPR